MELHQLQIGEQGTCSRRERDGRADRLRRVGGVGEAVAVPTGREDHGTGEHGTETSRAVDSEHTDDAITRAHQVDDGQVLRDGDVIAGTNCCCQHRDELCARCIAMCAHDSSGAVPCLSAESEPAVVVTIERGTELYESGDPLRTTFGQQAHHGRVADTRRHGERVGAMTTRGVAFADCSSDPTLCASAGPSYPQRLTRQETSLAATQRCAESRSAASDDDHRLPLDRNRQMWASKLRTEAPGRPYTHNEHL